MRGKHMNADESLLPTLDTRPDPSIVKGPDGEDLCIGLTGKTGLSRRRRRLAEVCGNAPDFCYVGAIELGFLNTS